MSIWLAKKTKKVGALIVEVDVVSPVMALGDNYVVYVDGESEVSGDSEASGESNLGEEEPAGDPKRKGPGPNTCTAPTVSSMEGFGGPSTSSGLEAVEGQDALMALAELLSSSMVLPSTLSEWATMKAVAKGGGKPAWQHAHGGMWLCWLEEAQCQDQAGPHGLLPLWLPHHGQTSWWH